MLYSKLIKDVLCNAKGLAKKEVLFRIEERVIGIIVLDFIMAEVVFNSLTEEHESPVELLKGPIIDPPLLIVHNLDIDYKIRGCRTSINGLE